MTEFSHPNDRIFLLLGEMRGDIKALLAARQEDRDEIDDLTKRISVLEHGKHFLLGSAAAVGALASAAVAVFFK